MGYSCTMKADNVLDALLKRLQERGPAQVSNGWTFAGYEYFFEQGGEQPDGAITGTVYKINNGLSWRTGSVRIDAGGQIRYFPTTFAPMRKDAMIAGLLKYHNDYEPNWKNDGLLLKLMDGCQFAVI